ncbi:hypothetical protein MLD38_013923 [Melastoma candidum]|uniref:Uncharacterized protein n=1 Tax=Melastoma candidum TaxID=119954 RepID=A0ACB9RJK9_9MYRT|nr:hypothetical protein MLD38_013923 [Melastoma candidum]
MADHNDNSPKFDEPSVVEKVTDFIHDHVPGHAHDSSSSSSSSSSDDDDDSAGPKVYRLFGRGRPLHHVLGAGMPADLLLWRNKKLSAGALGVATAIWVLFELMEYHLLTLVCHGLIATLAISWLWSNATTFINKKPPHIPEVSIPEQPILELISAVRFEINRSIAFLREVASGRDLKKFLLVIVGLWITSKVGSWCNFLTLFYFVIVILHTIPVLYEKHEDKVDPLAEKAMIEIKKHYAVVGAKILSKIPMGPLKEKKS